MALIIERLDKSGILEVIEEIMPPKDCSNTQRPRKIKVTTIVLN